ncbi:Spo11/DNA topoisomerase VI subunit A, partial [Lipomyces oligophaga]|uniref:Spo11/DNA topoisomerase VI subunit A n=1 Tax=Lipomyces oligophaga TaxID=45792 RepID=UPI0034CD34F0
KSESDKEYILNAIELMVISFLTKLERQGESEIKLVSRNTKTAVKFDKQKKILEPGKRDSYLLVKFPGSNARATWKFAVVLRILDFISDCLTHERIMTKRDIYYQDTKLFKSQQTVDLIIDDIARTLKVSRSSLGIVAAQKSLICGNYQLEMADCSVLMGSGDIQLIPTMDQVARISIIRCSYVLVVEKEAVFRCLHSVRFFDRLDIGSGILVTGKGYADIACRQFLFQFSDLYPSIPIFAIVDSDPHGIDIYANYKFGSRALAHENGWLTTPAIQWIGIKIIDYTEDSAWIPLSRVDRRKTANLLRKPWIKQDSEIQLRTELQRMLFLGYKCEMNTIGTEVNSVVRYITDTVFAHLNNKNS